MNFKHKIAGLPLAAWLLATPLVMALPAQAAEVWLQTGSTTVTMPDNSVVTMWGYASCTDGTFATCTPVSVPGPALTVPAADTSLTVHLKNTLSAPTSLVIPGQLTTMTPVWDDGASGARTSLTQRVRSFTNEAAAGATADYVWPNIKPGTYLYQSGTHPQVQVQMGLYGAMTKDVPLVSPAQAYPGVSYDNQITLLYSEVDPALHTAVADGSYGTPSGPTSTLNYNPKYFLVNGKPYSSTATPFAVTAGQRTLLRFLNAGLKTHVPILNGLYMDMIAEDGNLYPFSTNPRKQYSAFLPAAKTLDAIVVPVSPADGSGKYAILDRRLDLTTGASQDGGMLAFLQVAASTADPPAISSTAPTTATQGTPFSYQVLADTVPPGGALTYSLTTAPAGMTINAATGAIAWTPTNAQAVPVTPPRTATAAVVATNAGGLSASQSFTVTVANINDAPVAVNNTYSMVQGGVLNIAAPGVLGNDSDPDGDAMTAIAFSTPSAGALTSSNANGSFTYTPTAGFIGAATFTYQATDGLLPSAAATVTVNVSANRAPVAVNDNLSAPRCSSATLTPVRCRIRSTDTGTATPYTPVLLNVLTNTTGGKDTDPDTAIDPTNIIAPATVAISTGPNSGGTATVITATGAWPTACPRSGSPAAVDVGKICYIPKLNFKGTEMFSYRVRDSKGAQSNTATVRVTVQ
ncbi:MAG: Ig-like domain-containing protein [Burkholderiales bacterium]